MAQPARFLGLAGAAVAYQALLGALLAPPAGWMEGDSTEYCHLAVNLLRGRGYAYDPTFLNLPAEETRLDWIRRTGPQGLLRMDEDLPLFCAEKAKPGAILPTRMRQPLYPLFLATVFAIAGFRPAAVFAAQALLVLSAWISLYHIARRLWPKAALVAPMAVLTVALFVPLSLSSSLLMADALLVCVLAAAYRSSIRLYDTGRVKDAARSGVGFALASLTKPTGALTAALVLVPLSMRAAREGRIGSLVALWLAFLVPLVPWAVRNYVQCGSASPLSTEAGFNLWAGLFDPVSPFAIVHLNVNWEAVRRIAGDRYYIDSIPNAMFTRMVTDELRREPGDFALRGLSRLLGGGLLDFPGGRSFLAKHPAGYRVSQVGMLALWALWLKALIGLRQLRWVLVTPVIAMWLTALVTWLPPRAFTHTYLFLLTGATAGAIELVTRLQTRHGQA